MLAEIPDVVIPAAANLRRPSSMVESVSRERQDFLEGITHGVLRLCNSGTTKRGFSEGIAKTEIGGNEAT